VALRALAVGLKGLNNDDDGGKEGPILTFTQVNPDLHTRSILTFAEVNPDLCEGAHKGPYNTDLSPAAGR